MTDRSGPDMPQGPADSLKAAARPDAETRFEADPTLLLAIANAMAPLIPSGSDALAGLEMGGIPIVTTLSALCVIDRESGGKEALAGAGLELKSLFTYSQIIDESKQDSAE